MALRDRDLHNLRVMAGFEDANPAKIDRSNLHKTVVEGEKLKLKPRRLTRHERAKVRQFVRDSRKRNGRSRRHLREVEKRNARKLAEGGDRALVFYLQDQGAGVISVRQILSKGA